MKKHDYPTTHRLDDREKAAVWQAIRTPFADAPRPPRAAAPRPRARRPGHGGGGRRRRPAGRLAAADRRRNSRAGTVCRCRRRSHVPVPPPDTAPEVPARVDRPAATEAPEAPHEAPARGRPAPPRYPRCLAPSSRGAATPRGRRRRTSAPQDVVRPSETSSSSTRSTRSTRSARRGRSRPPSRCAGASCACAAAASGETQDRVAGVAVQPLSDGVRGSAAPSARPLRAPARRRIRRHRQPQRPPVRPRLPRALRREPVRRDRGRRAVDLRRRRGRRARAARAPLPRPRQPAAGRGGAASRSSSTPSTPGWPRRRRGDDFAHPRRRRARRASARATTCCASASQGARDRRRRSASRPTWSSSSTSPARWTARTASAWSSRRCASLVDELRRGRPRRHRGLRQRGAHRARSRSASSTDATSSAPSTACSPTARTNAEAGLRAGLRHGAPRLRRRRPSTASSSARTAWPTSGETGADEHPRAASRREADRGITLTTVGFGMGNYNDVLMEKLADQGDGNYYYVDRLDEAERVFRENLTGTLQTIARDAKVQVEFDPRARRPLAPARLREPRRRRPRLPQRRRRRRRDRRRPHRSPRSTR